MWSEVARVRGSKGNYYAISVDGQGQYGCSCPSWTKNTPREDCKHILKFKLDRALMEANERSDAYITAQAPAHPIVLPPGERPVIWPSHPQVKDEEPTPIPADRPKRKIRR